MKIKIRKATSNDVDVLFDLITKIAEYHGQGQYIATNKEKLQDAGFGASPKYQALIAEINETPIGFLSYTWNYSIWSGAEFMNLDDLFVLESFRGQKVGWHLMQYAKSICQEMGVELIRWEVEKDNARAIEFYRDLGVDINIKGIFRWKLNS
ncbi:MAG: N-acetyltransferase family protein [Allomuricauda sp.]